RADTSAKIAGSQFKLLGCDQKAPVSMKLIATVEALSIRDQNDEAPRQGCTVIELTLEGIVGDVNYGFTRPAARRDRGNPSGTPVRNWRQWSAVSLEELQAVAQQMGLSALDPCLLSANITFSGVKDFTRLPRGTQISFAGGAILTVEEE